MENERKMITLTQLRLAALKKRDKSGQIGSKITPWCLVAVQVQRELPPPWFYGCLGLNLAGRWGPPWYDKCICLGRVPLPPGLDALK